MLSKQRPSKFSFSDILFSVLLGLAALTFGYISITNHLLYRTFALDLGMFNHALYQITQFDWPTFSLSVDGNTVPYFADHFSPIIYLFAPLYAIFGHGTLLYIQVLSLLVFAYYIRKISIHFLLPPLVSALIPLVPLSCWAVFAAVGFDFHTNVFAAMLVAPVIYYTLRERLVPLSVFILLIMLSKENMSLWLFFILTGLWFQFKKDLLPKTKRFLFIFAGLSITYFVLATVWWMPALHPTGTNIQLNKYIGADGGLGGVIEYCVSHPLDTLGLLIYTPEGIISPDKLSFLVLFLASGGLLWFIHPVLLWMTLPIAAQKFLSLNGGPWGIEAQYSIEIVPIIGWGLILFLRHFSTRPSILFISLSVYVSLHFTYFNYFLIQPRVNFVHEDFSKTRFNIEELNDLMKKIPEAASVSCVSVFAPRLANRSIIYHFPNIQDAEYIALLKGNQSTYPLNPEQYQQQISLLKADTSWYAWNYTSDAVVFKRKK